MGMALLDTTTSAKTAALIGPDTGSGPSKAIDAAKLRKISDEESKQRRLPSKNSNAATDFERDPGAALPASNNSKKAGASDLPENEQISQAKKTKSKKSLDIYEFKADFGSKPESLQEK